MTYYITTIIKSCLFYFGFFPASILFYFVCKIEGSEGLNFWKNVKVNPGTIITSFGIWAIIAIIIAGLWIAGSQMSIPK